MDKDKKQRTSCIGYVPAPHHPEREHTPEELELIRDHVENWNPWGIQNVFMDRPTNKKSAIRNKGMIKGRK